MKSTITWINALDHDHDHDLDLDLDNGLTGQLLLVHMQLMIIIGLTRFPHYLKINIQNRFFSFSTEF